MQNQKLETHSSKRPVVIIIGAGFGGLFAARELIEQPVDVLLIDRNNYHTFTPLLYQVATAALDPSQIARPVRGIFRKKENVRFLLGNVAAIDTTAKKVTVDRAGEKQEHYYDYLVIAGGSTPAYFGNDSFADHTFELRTLSDSIRLRNHILSLFEQAVWTESEAARQALLTIVIAGGGPTGLETAGAVYELYNHVLKQEYSQEELHARVILVEMQEQLLAPYPPQLQRAALEQLQSLGVEVRLGKGVTAVHADRVELDGEVEIPTHTLIWSAGAKAAPIAELLNVELARGGQIPIEPTTRVQGLAHVYAIGDNAYLEDEQGAPYPMLIPVAQQQGKLAAQNILADLNGIAPKIFTYRDNGTMATIGRSRAVAWIFNRLPLRGRLAWFAWLGLHLIMLLGFRNRLSVFVNWVWNYLTYERSVRIIWRLERENVNSAPDDEGGERENVLPVNRDNE